jgi:hypothetical protein
MVTLFPGRSIRGALDFGLARYYQLRLELRLNSVSPNLKYRRLKFIV